MLIITLLTPMANADSMKWNSTNYELQEFEVSSGGGEWNSTSYESGVNTQHYQQQVGTAFSFLYQGVIRWLQTIVGINPTADVIWQVQACLNNNTLLIEEIEQIGLVNTTLTSQQLPCQYGCTEGRCVDIEQSVDYSKVVIGALIIILLAFILIFLKSKTAFLRLVFMGLNVLLVIIIVFIGTVPETLTNNSIIQSIGLIQLSMFQIIAIGIGLIGILIFGLWLMRALFERNNSQLGFENGEGEDEIL